MIFYFFGLLLIIHTNYLSANNCYECSGMLLNYTVTIDNIPLPNAADCTIVVARETCSVRIGWFSDNKTEVFYTTDAGYPADSIVALTDRRVTTWSGHYATRRFIFYTCNASNVNPCNTAENLKNVIVSTTFPTDEEMEKFDSLIVPTTDFDGRTCAQTSNVTDCPQTNLASCQQCMGILGYSEQINTCTMCPAGKALANFFDHTTTFFLKNQTQSNNIKIGCRKYGPCNSVENLQRIRQTLTTKFNFNKYYSSTGSISKLSITILLMMFIPLF